MKLYINYNFCGYHWFSVDDIRRQPSTESVTLDEFAYSKDMNPTLKKLMTYDSYHLAYMKTDGRYILALRNIPEINRTDDNGRRLLISYIFEGDEADCELMNKIAFTYILQKESIQEVFSAAISSTVDSVKYDIPKLTEWMEAISQKKLISRVKFGKGKVLMMLSKWKNETIAGNLGLDIDEVDKMKYPLDYPFNDYVILKDPVEITDGGGLVVGCEDDGGQEGSGETEGEGFVKSVKDIMKSLWSDIKAVILRKMTMKTYCEKHCVVLLILSNLLSLLLGVIIGNCF